MRKARSFLLRFIGVPVRTDSPDWWAYFGSFGDDFFGDEDIAGAYCRVTERSPGLNSELLLAGPFPDQLRTAVWRT